MNIAPVWLDGKLVQLALISPLLGGAPEDGMLEGMCIETSLTSRQEMEAHEAIFNLRRAAERGRRK